MIQVKPGQAIPISYVVSDGVAGLVIKASIEKFDGTVLASLVLTEVHPGDHSDDSFPMPTGLDFLKVKLSPFLSDGVTPDTAHPITQEIVGTVLPIIASRIKVEVGCEDQPLQSPVIVSQASDLNLLLSFLDEDGSSLDISSLTALSLSFKKVRPVAQADTLAVNSVLVGHTYSFQIWSAVISYTAIGGDTQQSILAALLAAIPTTFNHPNPCAAPITGVVSGTGSGALLTLTGECGVDIVYSAVDSLLTLQNLVSNILTKSVGSGITLVLPNQALVQMLMADFELLPRGDVDARIKLVMGGSNFAFNVYAAISIEPDAV